LWLWIQVLQRFFFLFLVFKKLFQQKKFGLKNWQILILKLCDKRIVLWKFQYARRVGWRFGRHISPRQNVLQFARVFEEKYSKKFWSKFFHTKKFENPLKKFLATTLQYAKLRSSQISDFVPGDKNSYPDNWKIQFIDRRHLWLTKIIKYLDIKC